MTTRDAVESTLSLVLVRWVMPALMAANIAAGSYWANLIYERQELAFMKINSLTVTVDGEHAARINEIERRLNSRKSPISDVRQGFDQIEH